MVLRHSWATSPPVVTRRSSLIFLSSETQRPLLTLPLLSQPTTIAAPSDQLLPLRLDIDDVFDILYRIGFSSITTSIPPAFPLDLPDEQYKVRPQIFLLATSCSFPSLSLDLAKLALTSPSPPPQQQHWEVRPDEVTIFHHLLHSRSDDSRRQASTCPSRLVAAGPKCLTYEDIKSLKNDWLTDNNIAFWEEWLEREVLPKYPQARIILLRPSMTFLLMKEPDMRQIRSALPDFSKVTHIFLPINDARNVAQAEGGSHWSLLLVSAIDGVAFHYDSLGGANYAEGRLATHKMSEILGRPLRYLNLDDSPQQENGSDCGVFVCILMRHLLIKRLLSANAREKVSMSMANKLIDSHGGRKEMLKIIESLRKEGERRRS
ncbi:Ulp1 protease family protein [Colletotrichum melonis]|uniref:Ulp1 protease family protein n=1 Tax=Colletotrichum melonis TaxID=1209925 RepID=A0AAI9U4N6_9PEZI|nr:Ulp1 protease family protein [Colletotrichum melonis]